MSDKTIQEILLEEVRLNRAEIQDIRKELAIFKMRAFGFMTLVSTVLNLTINQFLP